MLSFKEFLLERIRSADEAKALFARHQRRYPRSTLSKIVLGPKFGPANPVTGGRQKHPIGSFLDRLSHYPDDPRERPEPEKVSIKLKSVRDTQGAIDPETVHRYIDFFASNPDAAKNAGIHVYPGREPETKDIGDGHHRSAALRLLGYEETDGLLFRRKDK